MTLTKKGAAIDQIWKRLNGSIPDGDKATIVAQLMKALESENLQAVDMRKKGARTAVDSTVKKVIPSMPSTLRAVYDRKQKAVIMALSQLFVQHRAKGPESGKRVRRGKSLARKWSRNLYSSDATFPIRRGRAALVVPDDDEDNDATVTDPAQATVQAQEPEDPSVAEAQSSSALAEEQEQAEEEAEDEETAQDQRPDKTPVDEASKTATPLRTTPMKSINSMFNSMPPLPFQKSKIKIKPIDQITVLPSLTSAYRNQKLKPAQFARFPPSHRLNDMIHYSTSDITKLRVDCIVNAANSSLLGGGGVDGAIHRAAGSGLVNECRTLPGNPRCPTGEARITGAHKLPCKKVIHTVAPDLRNASEVPTFRAKLASCYRNALQLAVDNKMHSISIPALGTGIYRISHDDSATIALGEVRRFLDKMADDNGFLLDIVFCDVNANITRTYERYFPYVSCFFFHAFYKVD